MVTKKQMAEIRETLNYDYNALDHAETRGYTARDEDLWNEWNGIWGIVCVYHAMPKRSWTDGGEEAYETAVKVHERMAEVIEGIRQAHSKDYLLYAWANGLLR